MNYHRTGLITAAAFLLTLWGLCVQIGIIWKRLQRVDGMGLSVEAPTAVLSLNQFLTPIRG